MGLRDTTRVHGAIMDVARIVGLSPDDCNILLVSSRTLYMIQNYGDAEVFFLGRYAKAFDAQGRYTPVTAGDAEAIIVADAANAYGLEVVDMSCDIVPILNQIALALSAKSATCDCVPNGPQPPQPPTIEGDPPPPGFTEYDPGEVDRKCKIANMVVDDLLEMITLLIVNDVQEAALLGLSVMSSLLTLVVALLGAGPIGWGLAGLGTLATIIGFYLVNTVDLEEFKTLIETNRTELVCALFNATNNTSAFTTFRAVLATAGASGAQLGFIDVLNMINGLTALFFKPDDPTGQAIEDRLDGFVSITDCDECTEFGDDCGWILAPAGVIGVGSTAATIGTGEITMDGVEYTITATERPEQLGTYGIGMLIRGYWFGAGVSEDPNLPTPVGCVCCVGENDLEGTGGSGTAINLSRGRLCVAGCTTVSSNAPFPLVNTFDDYVFCYWQAPGPFTRTFTSTIP